MPVYFSSIYSILRHTRWQQIRTSIWIFGGDIINTFYSNETCKDCQNKICKLYGGTCRKYRVKRTLTENIEKKFCLFIAFVFMILSLTTHISCFSFGFMVGIGLAGWMLLPDKKEK